MKINFLTDNKAEVVLEVESVYKRPVEDRKIYKTEYIVNEFNKLYPNRQIVKVLQNSKINNFSDSITRVGVWVFELAELTKVKEVKVVPPQITPKPKNRVAKNKKSTKNKKTTKEG